METIYHLKKINITGYFDIGFGVVKLKIKKVDCYINITYCKTQGLKMLFYASFWGVSSFL